MSSRIGIFGGSFNPFHLGHLQCLNVVKKRSYLDKIYVVPTYQNPLKEKIEGPNSEQRSKIVEIALQEYQDDFSLDKRELEKEKATFTIDTLNEYKKENPDSDLFFILGADSFHNFDQWKSYEKILSIANLVVISRDGFEIPFSVEDLAPGIQTLVSEFSYKFIMLSSGKTIEFIKMDNVDASSSEIRRQLRMSQSVAKDLDINVENYLKEFQIYKQSSENFDDYMTFIKDCSGFLNEAKAINVRMFDMRDISDTTDFNLICSASSTRQASSLAEKVIDGVKKKYGFFPFASEGKNEGRWIVIDYGGALIHIFYDYVRAQYNLEELWRDAKEVAQ